MTTCYRCTSSVTHYPRIIYRADLPSGKVAVLRWLLRLGVCEEHRSPFPSEVLSAVSRSPLSDLSNEIRVRFEQMHGVWPNDDLTELEWLDLDHPMVVKFIHEAHLSRASHSSVEQAPVAIEHVTPEQLAEIMRSAPDIAIKH